MKEVSKAQATLKRLLEAEQQAQALLEAARSSAPKIVSDAHVKAEERV